MIRTTSRLHISSNQQHHPQARLRHLYLNDPRSYRSHRDNHRHGLTSCLTRCAGCAQSTGADYFPFLSRMVSALPTSHHSSPTQYFLLKRSAACALRQKHHLMPGCPLRLFASQLTHTSIQITSCALILDTRVQELPR